MKYRGIKLIRVVEIAVFNSASRFYNIRIIALLKPIYNWWWIQNCSSPRLLPPKTRKPSLPHYLLLHGRGRDGFMPSPNLIVQKRDLLRHKQFYYWSSWPIPWFHWEDLRAKETKKLLQDLLAVALKKSGIVMCIQILMLPNQPLHFPSQICPLSTVSWMIALQRMLCRVTWPNPFIFQSLIVARRYPCDSTRLLTLVRI